MEGNKDNVDNCPDTQASKTEEFSNAFLPMTQIKSVRSKTTKRDAQG